MTGVRQNLPIHPTKKKAMQIFMLAGAGAGAAAED
jgi:hypothetical protein